MSEPTAPLVSVIGLIDGFNLYHAIKDLRVQRYKWLDVIGLLKAFVSHGEELKQVYFFTALPPWNAEKRKRHESLLDCYRARNVNVIKGRFQEVTADCLGKCRERFITWEEKETDVNIALWITRIARNASAQKVLLVTADSDQVPSIESAKEIRPELQFKVIFPPRRGSSELRKIADQHAKISSEHLERHRLPDVFPRMSPLSSIPCPERWK